MRIHQSFLFLGTQLNYFRLTSCVSIGTGDWFLPMESEWKTFLLV